MANFQPLSGWFLDKALVSIINTDTVHTVRDVLKMQRLIAVIRVPSILFHLCNMCVKLNCECDGIWSKPVYSDDVLSVVL